MYEFYYKDQIIKYKLIKKNKKNLSIIIKENEVIVYSPIYLNIDLVQKILYKKADWIIKKLELNNYKREKNYENGEFFLYLGQEYTLNIIYGDKTNIKLFNNYLNLYINKKIKNINKKNIIELWYKNNSLNLFNKKVAYYNNFFKQNINEIRINDLKSAWGICYPKKRKITFNWKLIMAPIEIIDYVIVHEMCHLIHPNHSNNFWNEVSNYIKDYKIKRKWLKENGNRLFL
ncbi:hypothetical protein OSSY52_15730 [Tepiditoga spiralis]|uniref:YgjP-like metallopeptidase domain-containing protein n=1 Tax=Tepiditoga spiralis TaxID=2108365 RepID=A0A7G1GAY3_9BACT|nr:SprT family zinc-dependent metalloprotease [Tepiditoga spiralis]BBE31432.1 hypothetical protein OSSY52_15730 [Tepiditoga spiralis]